MAPMAQLVLPVLLVHKELKELLDPQEPLEFKVCKVPLELRAYKELRVFKDPLAQQV